MMNGYACMLINNMMNGYACMLINDMMNGYACMLINDMMNGYACMLINDILTWSYLQYIMYTVLYFNVRVFNCSKKVWVNINTYNPNPVHTHILGVLLLLLYSVCTVCTHPEREKPRKYHTWT